MRLGPWVPSFSKIKQPHLRQGASASCTPFMQVAQRYETSIAALLKNCVGLQPATRAPVVVEASSLVPRTPSHREAAARGFTLSESLYARMQDGPPLLVANVPIVFTDSDTGAKFVVVNGHKYVVMQRLRLAHWVPLVPDGSVCTPRGMLRAPGMLRKSAVEPGWSALDPDAERIVQARVESEPSASFDPYEVGTRRVVTADDAMLRLLIAAVKTAAASDTYNAADATAIIHRSLCTGDFPGNASGCTQLMATTNELAQVAQQHQFVHCRDMQRVPLAARHVHPSEFGFLCPVHTPDGNKVGLTRYRAAGCVVSEACDPTPWMALARSLPGSHELSVNGLPAHVRVDGEELRRAVAARRDGQSAHMPSVQLRGLTAWLWCDAGRMWTMCDDGRLHEAGELYDEQRMSGGAATPTRPLSVVAEALPLINMNQQARACFACAQMTQATGMFEPGKPYTQQLTRALWYGQRPLVQTAAPTPVCGVNVIMAVCTHNGNNMEDALLINLASLQRGMFTIDSYRRNINPTRGAMRDDLDGVPAPGLVRGAHDTGGSSRYGSAAVHMALVGRDANGASLKIVSNRHSKQLEAGDKLASRHGQKGVVVLVDEADMPFDPQNDTHVDVLFNPHGLPSRMSAGQLVEAALARIAALEGRAAVVDAFEKNVLKHVQKALRDRRLPQSGATRLVDGRTGKPMQGVQLVGPVFYTHQPHLSSEKAYCIGGNATVDAQSRQPVAGKSKGGALRCGEMETSALKSAGALQTLKQIFIDHCDNTAALMCNNCGACDAIDYASRRCLREACKDTDCVHELASMPVAVQNFIARFKALGIEATMCAAPCPRGSVALD